MKRFLLAYSIMFSFYCAIPQSNSANAETRSTNPASVAVSERPQNPGTISNFDHRRLVQSFNCADQNQRQNNRAHSFYCENIDDFEIRVADAIK